MKNIVKEVKLSLVVVGILSIVSSGLAEQKMPAKGPIPFSIYDKNKDGFVNQSEFYDARATRMSQKASQGKAMRNAGNAPAFEVFDKNNDGKLSKVELIESQLEQMAKKRANKSSKKKGMKKGKGQGNMQGQRNNQGMKKGKRQGNMQSQRNSQGRQQNSQGMKRNMPTFESFDANSDGFITQSEMDQAREVRMKQKASQGKMQKNSGNQSAFSSIDKNKDGKLDKSEFMANQMRKNR